MMSLGTDVIEISRIKHWPDDSEILSQVFTPYEINAIITRKHPHRQLAVIFAVKEAFMKAVGTGWSEGIKWTDIDVCIESRNDTIRLYNNANRLCEGRNIFVSGSSSAGLALAVVVID
ncbi:MAG TPA: holo-ACP synthase [Dissulfurispiraceae bacterium]|nr:holo-ACP synthase [Dissulfurispiraceae bacterium]